MSARRARRPPGLAVRVLAAQLLVVLTGVATAWIVAAAVGPPLFREHLLRADSAEASALEHAERAYASATGLALAVALAAALAAAVAVSLLAARRIGRSIGAVADTAVEVAAGAHDARVPRPRLGREFDALAESFNTMADRLSGIERTRRRLLADLAHELRTPTATLDGYLEAAREGVLELDGATLTMLSSQTRRLTRLAADMAAISEADEHRLHLRTADLRAFLAEAVDAHRLAAASAGIRLRTDLAEDLPPTTIDTDRLGQVVTNLLDNALRHTPPGGTVTVDAHARGTGTQVTVTDTGEGIAAEHLPHLLERFYRAETPRDGDHHGSGIGLAIARAVVEAHGGTICAASAGPGQGATFAFWIPNRSTHGQGDNGGPEPG